MSTGGTYGAAACRAGGALPEPRGIDVCADALLYRDGSTCTGWVELGAKHTQLLGWAERRRFRGSGTFDDEGNEIPIRRHHPDTPRRVRPRRFTLPESGTGP